MRFNLNWVPGIWYNEMAEELLFQIAIRVYTIRGLKGYRSPKGSLTPGLSKKDAGMKRQQLSMFDHYF